jgi:hypothetical protein
MRVAAAVTLSALAMAGCNGDDPAETRITREAARAGDAVERLERAIARRDFRRVCRTLFTRALRERLGGRRCPAMLRASARGVRRPRIRVEAISLQGSRARVRVVTTAARQSPARDVIVLVKERGAYRVDGLAGVSGER